MIEAIKACREKRMGYMKSAKTFRVPQSTLERYVKIDKEPEEIVDGRLGRKPVFSEQLEKELVKHCLELEKHFFGVTRKDICRLSFELCEKNNIKNPFNNLKQCAGSKWLRSFLKRNRELSFRTPQAISYARVKSFTKENVESFFDLYEPLLEKVNHNPARIFNCDETGITIVQHKHQKVVAMKGKRQVAALSSAERGSLMTVVMCFSATGLYIPPLIIFPRKNMKAELMNGMPPGSTYACHSSGWIQQEIFVQWITHFITNVKPTRDDPVILIVDGHYTHTRNLEVITVARENNVHIVCLPPHSTNKMQPLDVAFMSPFKTFYAQEITSWLKQNPGRVVTVYQIGELFGRAYMRAAVVETAVNGFRKTGLFPVNRNIFREEEFVAESLNANDLVHEVLPISETDKVSSSVEKVEATEAHSLTSTKLVLPSDLLPIPKLGENIAKKKRSNVGRAVVVTSSPYKYELETSLTKKNGTSKVKRSIISVGEPKKLENPKSAPEKKRKQTKIEKRRLSSSSSSNSEVEINLDDGGESPLTEDENDAACMFCSGLFSGDCSGEEWIRCIMCVQWAHSECAGYSDKKYICDFCK